MLKLKKFHPKKKKEVINEKEFNIDDLVNSKIGNLKEDIQELNKEKEKKIELENALLRQKEKIISKNDDSLDNKQDENIKNKNLNFKKDNFDLSKKKRYYIEK